MRLALCPLLTVGIVSSLMAQTIDSAVPIPMRDGVVLRATLLKPPGPGPFPVLVYRTPYGQTSAVTGYPTFKAAVARGYAIVAQDVRGRYLSDGEFNPYRQEGTDGYDTIEWAANQPWSTGAVGSFGLSYPGAVQWLAAAEAPPHLKAMVPAMTFSRPTNFWYAGGTTDLSWPAWIWLNIGPDVRRRKNLPGPRTDREARTAWGALKDDFANRLPVTNLPEFDQIAPWLGEWYRHPADDPWWNWADLTSKYGRVGAAVLNVSGWHDDNYGPEGALTNHLGLLAARAGDQDPKSFLILGPWVHGVGGMSDRTPGAKSGERVFGATAGIDYDEEILSFMDRYVRGLDNGADRSPRYRVFVMGENAWRAANTWPLPGTTLTQFHLSGAGGLTRSRAAVESRRTILSDPAKPNRDQYADAAGAHDYRRLVNGPNVMVYETPPLDRDLRVVGNIEARITFETDAPSIDVWAKLLDVGPDGTAWNVMSAGLDVERVDRPQSPHQVVLRNLLTGNLFKRGHRIRLVVMNSFMPNFSRNPQTGRSETVESSTRPARFTVLHGAGYDSYLALPVIP